MVETIGNYTDSVNSVLPNAQIIKCKGYINNNDYSKAKSPLGSYKKKPSLTNEEIDSHLTNGGWIGAVIPSNHIIIDVDNNESASSLHELLKGEGLKFHLINSPRGKQFIFKSTTEENQKIKMISKYVTSIGVEIDTRVGTTNSLIVFPTHNTENRFISEVANDLSELPPYLKPLWNIAQSKDYKFPIPLSEGSRNAAIFELGSKAKMLGKASSSLIEQSLKLVYKYFLGDKDGYTEQELQATIDSIKGFEPKAQSFELFANENKDSTLIELKAELRNRYFEELASLESEWIANGKIGKKPTTISPARCSIILPEYISFSLFNLEENTRLAMYLPKEGIYSQNTTLIKRTISWLEPKLNNVKADEVIYHLTNKVEIKEKTESRYLIPVQNGVFNLKTKTLEPFSADYVFTSKISTPYIENPTNPILDGWDIESWLNSISCGDSEIYNLLWQVMNDSLNGNYSRKKSIFLIGNGNNGKGTFQELLTSLIGSQNIATLKVNEFDQRFRLSILEGKTAVIGDDVPANVYIDDSSNFNSVVTGDRVAVEFKNKPIYNTVFRCSVIQSTNGMPKFKNKTNGTIRRIVIVPFQADFNGQAENLKIKDDFIRNEEVLQYVLNKAINMDFEKFDVPKVSLQELEIFKQDNDPILDFKLSVFDEWQIQKVPKYVVYGFYKKFCNDNGYKYSSDRHFHKQFKTYLEQDWKTDAQAKYNYESLMEYLGDLDQLGIGFPNRGQNQKSYENTRLKVM